MEDKVGYYHKRLDTGEIFYVGIGTPSRPYEDKHRNNHWNHIVEKVGHEVILVEENLSWDEACEWEKFVLITEERRTNISLATKQAMSNPEIIQKMKDAKVDFTPWNSGMKGWNSGKDNPNYGNYWSDEKKNEQGKKIKEAYKDGFSEEHIVKLKEKRKGRKPALGMKHSEETKRKMSESRKGKPQQKLTCPHCDKTGGNTNMVKYHFDNCKKK